MTCGTGERHRQLRHIDAATPFDLFRAAILFASRWHDSGATLWMRLSRNTSRSTVSIALNFHEMNCRDGESIIICTWHRQSRAVVHLL